MHDGHAARRRSSCCRSTCRACCGSTPLATGLLLLPGGLLMGLLGPVVGRLYDRFGARALLVPGTVVDEPGAVVDDVARRARARPGRSSASTCCSAWAWRSRSPRCSPPGLGALPPHLYSYGSAIFGTTQQLAGAAGVALLVSVYSVPGGGAGRTSRRSSASRAGCTWRSWSPRACRWWRWSGRCSSGRRRWKTLQRIRPNVVRPGYVLPCRAAPAPHRGRKPLHVGAQYRRP